MGCSTGTWPTWVSDLSLWCATCRNKSREEELVLTHSSGDLVLNSAQRVTNWLDSIHGTGSSSSHMLKIPQLHQTALPTGYQVFKHMSLRRTCHIQTFPRFWSSASPQEEKQQACCCNCLFAWTLPQLQDVPCNKHSHAQWLKQWMLV